MSYHYDACGLDNVYLVNGYTIEQDPDYGELVHIEDIDELHEEIARALIVQRRPLTGAEFKFLRVFLDLSQHRLAVILGSKEQNVRNWETKGKDKPVSNQSAERMLRVYALDYLDGESRIRELIERLTQLDAELRAEICLQRDGHWQSAA
ncbi:hypothetical protein J7444_08355 [Labrenzia sp. R4_1]|uniref:helix-turn-helix domain-containing protein n=1 Tax=Labrenzia sp. R4_1 TaxID=2821106 RepID=UPI001ADA82A2|nr:hypothetical protein [Labrenzia sp. R4_1]MBO9424730.1 hypothetical protein [Labrenzia sp. R4_1]